MHQRWKKQLNNAVKILQRRQIRIEDPGVRAQVATTLTTVSQYSDLLALYQQDSEISNHLQTLAQNNIAQFAQFSSEVSQLVDTIELRNQHGLAHLEKSECTRAIQPVIAGDGFTLRTDSDPLARGLSLSHASTCRTNAGAATAAGR